MAARDPLKVLILTSSYPRTPDDTASVFLRYLARGLHKRGIAVHVLAPADEAYGMVDEGGIRVTRFRYLPRRWRRLAYGSGMLPNLRRNPQQWLAVPFYLAAMLAKTAILTRRLRPHILHAHWILPQGLIAALVKLLTGVPVVTTAHGGDAFALRHPFLRTLKAFTLRHVDAWTANTTATAAATYTPHPRAAARIIPMGVDVDRFRNGSGHPRAQAADAEYVVLYVGRLVDKKGVDDLIRGYALLDRALRHRTKLWIVGSGDREDALRALAQELEVTSAVRFWGTVANQRLPDFYAAADIFVAPSVIADSGDTEGQGVVFLEAFAAGVPVIASNVGGIGEIVHHNESGWLVPSRQPDALSAAVERLLSDRALRSRLASNAHRRVTERYDWRVVAEQFHELYLEALSPS